jgi:glutamate synthase (NADPH/NADH) small chain
MNGCPVSVRIPEFIHFIKEGEIEKAYEVLSEDNTLPAICGRVCPQESQCEGRCVRGIKGQPVAVGRLERFVADYIENARAIEDFVQKPLDMLKDQKGKTRKVAVIGSGPAGLTCAGELAKEGVQVTLFEALHKIGGVLTYGIPEFRLPKSLIEKEGKKLESLGVEIQTNTLIGRSYTIEQLEEMGYEAVFIGSGAGLPRFMGIEGENLNGVYSANEYLTRVNLMKAYEADAKTPIQKGGKVVVVGGGNVAMDAARTAKRLGAEEVSIVYRRSEEELPARLEEIHHAKEEGIIFKTLNNPVAIKGDDFFVKGIQCQKMELGQADQSGRRSPIPVKDAYTLIECDTVIIAIGQTPNPLIKMSTPEIETYSWGGIKVDETTMKTNMENIYAGGDATTGAATVIKAMGAGKIAAKEIVASFKLEG